MNTERPSTKASETALAGAQRLIAFLCVILIFSVLLAGVSVPLTQLAHATSRQVDLWKGDNIVYQGDGWNAHMFFLNDGEGVTTAYCVEPSLSSPKEGTYDKSPISSPSHRDAELIAQLWFAYGGPGFDPSMWPSTNWDGAPMSDQDYYLASHILLADTYCSSGYKATYGATEAFRRWIEYYITGLDMNTAVTINPNAVGRLAVSHYGEVPADFEAFQINNASKQDIVGFSAYRPYGAMKLSKRSANGGVTNGNPNHSLKGIEYGVYTVPSCTHASDTGMRLKLDASGYAEIPDIHAGSYYVREIETTVLGTGYAYNDKAYNCVVRPGIAVWVGSNSMDERAVLDNPATRSGDILLQKYDLITQSTTPSGDADLSNAFFEVRFFANATGDATGQPTRTWNFKTDGEGKVDVRNNLQDAFVSGDALYRDASTQEVVFPLGTYAIREITAPASYEPPLESESVVLVLEQTGSGAHDVSSPLWPDSGIRFDQAPVRHDLSFTKRDLDTQRPMANVPFLVSRVAEDGTIIERHVAVTNKNGVFNSSAERIAHSCETNKNDEALVVKSNGRFAVDEEMLDSERGVWFGVAKDGSWSGPNDDFGAFPDSVTTKYVFEELPVTANQGKALVRFEAYAHESQSSMIDLGTFGNSTPTLATTARDAIDGDKIISKAPRASVVDTVSYTGLIAGQSYLLRASLLEADSGMTVCDGEGSPITAETEFTAAATAGTIDVEIPFDASSMEDGEKLVVVEELIEADRILATHWDLLDSAQTVTIIAPTLQTHASDGTDGDSVVTSDLEATIRDTVSYTGLVPGREYVLTGTVMLRDSASPLESNAMPVSASIAFTPKASSGQVTVDIAFDASALTDGAELVVFEELFCDDALIAAHADIDDANQTVSVQPPHLETKASDPLDGDNVIAADIESVVVDTVRFSGLTPGREYVLEGALLDRETGHPLLDAHDCPVTATHRFTPIEREGSTDVTFTFDASNASKPQGAVVIEELYGEGRNLADHADLLSAEQTVIIEPPSIRTFASADGSSKSVMKDDGVTLVDEVSYANLRPGTQYSLQGTLMDRMTGKSLQDDEGTPISVSADFTPDQPAGSVRLEFTFDATTLNEGDEIVVFERLCRNGTLIVAHEDLEDTRQTVTIAQPRIATDARSVDETKDVVRDRRSTIIDHVSYEGLAPGSEYEVIGSVMDATTGSALLDATGNEVVSQSTFIADHVNGNVDVTFEFDASALEDGHKLVVYEKLYRNGKIIATHEDLDSSAQTITIVPVSIVTYASDPSDGDKIVAAHAQTRIIDSVSYRGLEQGAEYEIVGTLMDVESEEMVSTAQGNPAQSSMLFTAQSNEGVVDVAFSFDATAASETRDVVVFERLYRDDVLIATHADFGNSDQTVSVEPVRIETYASDGEDGDKNFMPDGRGSIVDAVNYTGLIPGQEYEIKGALMINDGTLDGTPLCDSFGMPYQAHVSFTPSATHGTVNVSFDIDGAMLERDMTLVAFEELYCGQALQAQHADLQDEDQTVYVRSRNPTLVPADLPLGNTENRGKQVYTGDHAALMLVTYGVIGAISLGILRVLRRKAFGSATFRE